MRRSDPCDLIPGLPNSVILDCILPRVPWHARPVLLATSKQWNLALQEPRIYSQLSRRSHRALSPKGVVVLHHLSEAETRKCFQEINSKRFLPRPHGLSILEDPNSSFCHINMIQYTDDSWTWRRLPPIPAFTPLRILHDCGIACVNGKIFVMGGWDPRTGAVCAGMYMLDIAAGLWRWEIMPPMKFPRAFLHCTSDAEKIYVLGGSSGSHIHDRDPDPDPEMYSVETQTWELLPRVVMSRSLHYNGVSFVKKANLLVTHGFYTTERGELVRFWRAYNHATRVWCDYEGAEEADDCIVSNCVDATINHSIVVASGGDKKLLSQQERHQIGVIEMVMMD